MKIPIVLLTLAKFVRVYYMVPIGTGNQGKPGKWEGIFQSGKSQGILSRLEKSGNFAQNTGKTGKFE